MERISNHTSTHRTNAGITMGSSPRYTIQTNLERHASRSQIIMFLGLSPGVVKEQNCTSVYRVQYLPPNFNWSNLDFSITKIGKPSSRVERVKTTAVFTHLHRTHRPDFDQYPSRGLIQGAHS